jgi:hypothetical protein
MNLNLAKWQVLQIVDQNAPEYLDFIDRAYEAFCSYCQYRGERHRTIAEAAKAFCEAG